MINLQRECLPAVHPQLSQSFSWFPCRPSQQLYEQHLSLPNRVLCDQWLIDLLARTFLPTLCGDKTLSSDKSQSTKKDQEGVKALVCLDKLRLQEFWLEHLTVYIYVCY